MLNHVIAALLPYIPKGLVRRFAGRYIAGEATHEALEVARQMNKRGFEATIDILGEHTTAETDAIAVADAYIDLYHQIAESGLRCNISLKPTHLGLGISLELCQKNLLRIISAARETGNFLRIDMENSPYTDDTLTMYSTCLEEYDRVGPVLQAYLFRSQGDLNALMSPKLNFRLCKGIYRESLDIAFQDREAINDNFIALLRQAFEGEAYVAIATHDRNLIDQATLLIQNLAVPPDRFEFQVLYGVPMDGKLELLAERGFRIRIYIPFGSAWYAYSLRRLQENPNIAGYVLGNLFRRG